MPAPEQHRLIFRHIDEPGYSNDLACYQRNGGYEVLRKAGVTYADLTGYFDVTDLTWAPLGDATAASTPDAPSLTVALEEKLGIKLVPAKDPIEVLVIDSIDRPSEN